jgi:hypothetical protein
MYIHSSSSYKRISQQTDNNTIHKYKPKRPMINKNSSQNTYRSASSRLLSPYYSSSSMSSSTLACTSASTPASSSSSYAQSSAHVTMVWNARAAMYAGSQSFRHFWATQTTTFEPHQVICNRHELLFGNASTSRRRRSVWASACSQSITAKWVVLRLANSAWNPSWLSAYSSEISPGVASAGISNMVMTGGSSCVLFSEEAARYPPLVRNLGGRVCRRRRVVERCRRQRVLQVSRQHLGRRVGAVGGAGWGGIGGNGEGIGVTDKVMRNDDTVDQLQVKFSQLFLRGIQLRGRRMCSVSLRPFPRHIDILNRAVLDWPPLPPLLIQFLGTPLYYRGIHR